MKIKLYAYVYPNHDGIEIEINKFIKDKKIIDIKFSAVFEGPKESFEHMSEYFLIMYEDN